MKEFKEQQEKEIKEWNEKLSNTKDEWLKANLQRLGIPTDSAKTRCKVVEYKSAWYVENLTLYVDERIVSVLSIDTLNMEIIVENSDGFRSTGSI